MLLFLDIDGVLHPEPTTTPEHAFCQRAELWRLLGALPSLRVVVTSTWRERYPLEMLTALILHGGGEHLAARFVGVTPNLPALKNAYAGREREILAWLDTNAPADTRWLAIDDTASGFTGYSAHPRLYLTDYRSGLLAGDVDRIIERFEADK